MKFAYADPPYIGQAQKHYRRESMCDEVDHTDLISRLEYGGYDGWALSASSPSLQTILPLCPARVRVMAWVKPFCSFKKHVNPAYAWEPVIVCGGRKRTTEQPTIRDWIAESITLERGLSGVKPRAFCYWLFDVWNMQAGDELIDLFPGSGAVTEAWTIYEAYVRSTPVQLRLM